MAPPRTSACWPCPAIARPKNREKARSRRQARTRANLWRSPFTRRWNRPGRGGDSGGRGRRARVPRVPATRLRHRPVLRGLRLEAVGFGHREVRTSPSATSSRLGAHKTVLGLIRDTANGGPISAPNLTHLFRLSPLRRYSCRKASETSESAVLSASNDTSSISRRPEGGQANTWSTGTRDTESG